MSARLSAPLNSLQKNSGLRLFLGGAAAHRTRACFGWRSGAGQECPPHTNNYCLILGFTAE
jgi:hypothetical protein